MTIQSQSDVFMKRALQWGEPMTKQGAMELGFFGGFVAALKLGNDISHEASELETARRYEAMRIEMAQFFEPENIKRFYGQSVVRRNGKAKNVQG